MDVEPSRFFYFVYKWRVKVKLYMKWLNYPTRASHVTRFANKLKRQAGYLRCEETVMLSDDTQAITM